MTLLLGDDISEVSTASTVGKVWTLSSYPYVSLALRSQVLTGHNQAPFTYRLLRIWNLDMENLKESPARAELVNDAMTIVLSPDGKVVVVGSVLLCHLTSAG